MEALWSHMVDNGIDPISIEVCGGGIKSSMLIKILCLLMRLGMQSIRRMTWNTEENLCNSFSAKKKTNKKQGYIVPGLPPLPAYIYCFWTCRSATFETQLLIHIFSLLFRAKFICDMGSVWTLQVNGWLRRETSSRCFTLNLNAVLQFRPLKPLRCVKL